jgi:ISXO2-like transposase domain
MWLVVNCKNGVSSYEVARDLKVTQKSAWFMNHRIRLAVQSGTFEKVSGEFEVDESFIGGLARNMHKDKKAKITGTGGAGKAIVMGIFDRKTKKIRLRHVANTQRETLKGVVRGVRIRAKQSSRKPNNFRHLQLALPVRAALKYRVRMEVRPRDLSIYGGRDPRDRHLYS